MPPLINSSETSPWEDRDSHNISLSLFDCLSIVSNYLGGGMDSDKPFRLLIYRAGWCANLNLYLWKTLTVSP